MISSSYSNSFIVGPANAKYSMIPVIWECPWLFGCPNDLTPCGTHLDCHRVQLWDIPWPACSPLYLKNEWANGVPFGSFIHYVVNRTFTNKGHEIYLSQTMDRLSFPVYKCHFLDQERYFGSHKISIIQFLFSSIEK